MKLLPKNNFLIIPNGLIEDYSTKLKPIQFKFMIVLLYLSQRFSTDKFYYTDKQITKKFDISANSLNRSRVRLAELGLIKYQSGFRTKSYSMATRYQLLPSKALRKSFRIRTNQKEILSKPP